MKLLTIVISCIMLLITGCASNQAKQQPAEPKIEEQVIENKKVKASLDDLYFYIQETWFAIVDAQKQGSKTAEKTFKDCKGLINLGRIKREYDYTCLYALFRFSDKIKTENPAIWLEYKSELEALKASKDNFLEVMKVKEEDKTLDNISTVISILKTLLLLI